VEPYAERVQRLLDGNQPDQALKVLDDGLRSLPENPLLAQVKATLLARRGDLDGARELMARVVAKHATHAASQTFYLQLLLETEGANVAAGHFQQALPAVPIESRTELSAAAEAVAQGLAGQGLVPAALAHMTLSRQLEGSGADSAVDARLRLLEGNPGIQPWLRNPYRLSRVPAGLDEDRRRRFEQALEWADQGSWSPAAAAFDLLSAEGTPESDRNLGLCRLWLGDHSGAVSALRRYTSWVGPTPDTVDLEALCQIIDEPGEQEHVEILQWIWPLRDRQALVQALESDPCVRPVGRAPIDPEDPNSVETDRFLIVDRPPPAKSADLTPADIPRIRGVVFVGQEITGVESADDGRLESLGAWFRQRAAGSIPPAHPRTKVIGRSLRETLALNTDWLLPKEVEESEGHRLTSLEQARVIREVLPDLPLSALGGRTARQAAGDKQAALPLRATLMRFEHGPALEDVRSDVIGLRQKLGVPSEPQIDPATTTIAAIHLTRLHLVPAVRLDDKRLIELYERARRYMVRPALVSAAKALLQRPHLLDREGTVSRLTIFSDLARASLVRGDRDDALQWIERGRQAESPASRARNAPTWDLLEVRVRATTEQPESWVPQLAVVLERYKNHKEAGSIVLRTLLDLGLVQAVPSPDRDGEIFLDSRSLQAVLAKYGPRVTTSTGALGVSAARSEIWTPSSDASGPAGNIWTPGTDSSRSAAEPKRLIIPG
jgi:hypothetical protein